MLLISIVSWKRNADNVIGVADETVIKLKSHDSLRSKTSFNIYHTLLHIYFHNCYALEVYEFN